MKKKISFFVLTIMLATTAMAGSIYNLDYKDRNWCGDSWRQINDNNAIVNADTVKGYTVDELIKDDATQITYAHGSSLSMRTMSYYVTGDRDYFENHEPGYYQSYLDEKYLEQEDFDEIVRRMVILQDKIDALQKRVYELEIIVQPQVYSFIE